jgi:hypothetical protein
MQMLDRMQPIGTKRHFGALHRFDLALLRIDYDRFRSILLSQSDLVAFRPHNTSEKVFDRTRFFFTSLSLSLNSSFMFDLLLHISI